MLTIAPMLVLPNLTSKFEAFCDAFGQCLGCVLV